MENLFALLTIGALYLATKASPGPIFLVLSHYSMAGLKRSAIMIAIGTTTGSFAWALLSMAGISAILAKMPWLYLALKVVGAVYLIYLGLSLWRTPTHKSSASRISAGITEIGLLKALRVGLITSFTNPKSGVFWTSVFVVAFPTQAPDWMYVATLSLVIAISFGWHMLLVTLFSSMGVHKFYLRARRKIDRFTGTLLVAFGLKLLTDDR